MGSATAAAVRIPVRAAQKQIKPPRTAARKTAMAVGALFLSATATYAAGNGLISSALSAPHGLSNLNGTHIRLGVFLEFVNAVANVGVGVVLFPILRQHRERMAIGYLATRIIESLLLLVSSLAVLMLVPVGQDLLRADAATASQLATVATLAMQGYHLAFQLAEIALSVGALTLCYVLYEARLVPRPLAVLGFAGYVALFASGWLYIAGHHTVAPFLYVPGGLFEFILPLWLIVKGFRDPAPAGNAHDSDELQH